MHPKQSANQRAKNTAHKIPPVFRPTTRRCKNRRMALYACSSNLVRPLVNHTSNSLKISSALWTWSSCSRVRKCAAFVSSRVLLPGSVMPSSRHEPRQRNCKRQRRVNCWLLHSGQSVSFINFLEADLAPESSFPSILKLWATTFF
jgi:hypothetical protein